jgi:hypothetical protein
MIKAKAVTAPVLPQPPKEWTPDWQADFNKVLNDFFRQLVSVHAINGASLNLNVDSLPVVADLANLISGDVYRDTTASQVLKVKP